MLATSRPRRGSARGKLHYVIVLFYEFAASSLSSFSVSVAVGKRALFLISSMGTMLAREFGSNNLNGE